MVQILEKIEHMLTHNGKELYGGEAVTQTQHALQCASLAERLGASDALIAASLLHDIGHFLEPDFETASKPEEDMQHEELGNLFLSAWFGENVTVPVKLHVAAKRYLCATDPDYFSKLSPASVHSLELQGGPMDTEEINKFESYAFYQDAVRLRVWDDLAKDPQSDTADVGHFMQYVESSLKPAI